jgi:hypothetical protein
MEGTETMGTMGMGGTERGGGEKGDGVGCVLLCRIDG